MSNYLAIATVTAALQRMLQAGIREDVPGAQVTTVRPDSSASGNLDVGINIFLYQVTPNPAWRNADLRTRRPKGDLSKHGQAGLDLHYLMTFYGNEQELEPQRLLGSMIRTLVDKPILSHEMIQETINSSSFPYLRDSTLVDQIQLVKFLPGTLTADELSRIWSIFFQIPYSLSFPYQASAVLIQGDKPGKAALPVRRRQFLVTPERPVIEQVEINDGAKFIPLQKANRVVCDRNLIIQITGKQLKGNNTKVQIGKAQLTPQTVSDTQVKLQFSSLSTTEVGLLQAGVQNLQVIHLESGQTIESNVIPMVLCPTINATVEITNSEDNGYDLYSAQITVSVDLNVDTNQRVFLLLNSINSNRSQSYIFAAKKRSKLTNLLRFNIADVMAGEYLVRVQIDGAESPLIVENECYCEPLVEVN